MMRDPGLRKRTVLEHCRGEFRSLKPLLQTIPRTSLYRCADELVANGELESRGSLYRTTPKGEAQLQAQGVWDGLALAKVIPALNRAPTDHHRAAISLTLAQVSARHHRLAKEHYLSPLLLGTTHKWKTWVAQFVAAFLGLDPARCILLLPSESGRSIGTRKGFGGKTISARQNLSQPFICLDEFGRAEASVRRYALIYLQGSLQVSHENELLDVCPTTLVAMNPLSGGDLPSRTGLDWAILRRTIPCDLTSIDISPELWTRGEEILAAVARARLKAIPKPRPIPVHLRETISTIIHKCATPAALSLIDVEGLLLTVAGMTAYLPEREAFLQTLYDYFTLVETIGWARKEWRQAFLALAQEQSTAQPSSGSAPTPSRGGLREQVQTLLNPSEKSDLAFDAKVAKVTLALREVGIEADHAVEYVRWWHYLQSLGFTTQSAHRVAQELHRVGGIDPFTALLARWGSLSRIVQSLGQQEHQLKTSIAALSPKKEAIEAVLRVYGSDPRRVERLCQLERTGFTLEAAQRVATEMRAIGLPPQEGARRLGETIARYGTLQQALLQLQRHKEAAEQAAREARAWASHWQQAALGLKEDARLLTEKRDEVVQETQKRLQELRNMSGLRGKVRDQAELMSRAREASRKLVQDVGWLRIDAGGLAPQVQKSKAQLVNNARECEQLKGQRDGYAQEIELGKNIRERFQREELLLRETHDQKMAELREEGETRRKASAAEYQAKLDEKDLQVRRLQEALNKEQKERERLMQEAHQNQAQVDQANRRAGEEGRKVTSTAIALALQTKENQRLAAWLKLASRVVEGGGGATSQAFEARVGATLDKLVDERVAKTLADKARGGEFILAAGRTLRVGCPAGHPLDLVLDPPTVQGLLRGTPIGPLGFRSDPALHRPCGVCGQDVRITLEDVVRALATDGRGDRASESGEAAHV